MTDQERPAPRYGTPEYEVWFAASQERWREERKKRLQEVVPIFTASKEAFIQDYLVRTGVAQRDLPARWDQIPGSIRKVLPAKWQGFGLVGGTGIGKTCALVAMLRLHAEATIAKQMATLLGKDDPGCLESCIQNGSVLGNGATRFRWVYWPSQIYARRGELSRKQHVEVEDWISSLQDPEYILILDDIGSDRQTAQDWAGEVLSRIVDERYLHEATTAWTCNASPQELSDRYGSRLCSRLFAMAPAIVLSDKVDTRLPRIAS